MSKLFSKHASAPTLALLAALTGCLSIDDLTHLAADAGADASVAPDARVTDAYTRDSGSVRELDTSVSPPPEPDAAFPWVQIDAANLPCSEQVACPSDYLCAPDDRCIPRCEGTRCVVAIDERRTTGSLAVEGSTLYIGYNASRDRAGNPREDAAVVRLDPDGTQKVLASGALQSFPRSLLVHGEYLYWHAGDKLWRARKDGSEAARALYDASCWQFHLFGEGELAVRNEQQLLVGRSDGSAQLRLLSSNGRPYDCSAVRGYQGELWWAQQDKLVATEVSSGQERTIVALPSPSPVFTLSLLELAPPHAYVAGYTMMKAFELARPVETLHSVQPLDAPALHLDPIVRGDWAYVVHRGSSSETVIERWSMREPGEAQLLGQVSFESNGYPQGAMAVSDTHVYYAPPADPRTNIEQTILYNFALAPSSP